MCMRISELIKVLEKIQEHEGDLFVTANDECGSTASVVKEDICIMKAMDHDVGDFVAHSIIFDC